jgi:biotin-(acetyl-CoA carboxylase) ligase
VLIEMENDHMVIGIGVNVMTAPDVAVSGSNSGRPSTALCLHSNNFHQVDLNRPSFSDPDEPAHHLLSKQILRRFERWLAVKHDPPQQVIEDFSRHMDMVEQTLRDSSDPDRQRVQPIRLNPDGTLLVIPR